MELIFVIIATVIQTADLKMIYKTHIVALIQIKLFNQSITENYLADFFRKFNEIKPLLSSTYLF